VAALAVRPNSPNSAASVRLIKCSDVVYAIRFMLHSVSYTVYAAQYILYGVCYTVYSVDITSG